MKKTLNKGIDIKKLTIEPNEYLVIRADNKFVPLTDLEHIRNLILTVFKEKTDRVILLYGNGLTFEKIKIKQQENNNENRCK